MTSERSASKSKPSRSVRLVRNGLAGLLAIAGLSALASGCLDRPVVPAEPTTQNIFVSSISETAVNKIDLLFMIDNSSSMADKQNILEQAVPQLLSRLITPDCVDSTGVPIQGVTVDAQGNCSQGQPEFHAVRDIHIGIVTSSLGDRGANVCLPHDQPPADDMGELVATPGLRSSALPSYKSAGFLAWEPDTGGGSAATGETSASQLVTDFTNEVKATGEAGCGFESQLEGWYRFLVDPNPPTHLDVTGSGGAQQTVKVGVPDKTVLAERAAFLRPDSLVAIIMLSDENDCSMLDHGQAFLLGNSGHVLPHATSACATNPNSPCCFSCGSTGAAPSGCTPAAQDPNCKTSYNQDPNDDNLNERCFAMKQRFGISLLFPTQRYVNALTQPQICPNHDDLSCGQSDTPVANPLFNQEVGGKAVPSRSPSLVFLAGIIGVPWQDIATKDSLNSNSLTYLTAKELNQPFANAQGQVNSASKTYWDLILGSPEASPPVPPLDPFMHESIAQRSGTNPVTGAPIQPPTTSSPNPINGHEYSIPDGSDLQYACIFNLPQSRDCSLAANAGDCDCSSTLATYKDNPLCTQNEVNPACGGTNQPACSTTQYSAKGYPGLRELEVLKGIGDNAIVGSICPKNVCSPGASNCSDPNYGYNPAVNAIIDRLKSALSGQCLPRQLSVTCTDAKGNAAKCGTSAAVNVSVPCKVVEATQSTSDKGCALPGHSALTSGSTDSKVRSAVVHLLEQQGVCSANGGGNKQACSTYNMCYIDPTPGSATNTNSPEYDCLNNAQVGQAGQATYGYCYIDPSEGSGNKTLVANCPATEQRLLRLVSAKPATNPIPQASSETFVACSGKAFSTGGQ